MTLSSQPRRILMTADTVGGVWTFAIELAAALSNGGTEILLATLGGEPSCAQRSEAAKIPGLILTTSHYKLEWMEEPWEDLAASGKWLQGLVRSFRPGLLHLNTFAHASLVWDCPVVLTAHSCVASWWLAVKGTLPPPAWNRYRDLVHAALLDADAVVSPSAHLLSTLCTLYALPDDPSKYRVIANGRLPAAHGTGKEPFILTAGRLWDEAKGLDILLAAAPRLPWPLYLAGEQPFPAPFYQNCIALGSLSAHDLSRFYMRAAVYALPARYEPFGLSVLEAAQAGCALVLADIASLRENWNGAAVFVTPDDPDDLTAKISALAADSALRIELSRAAAERARQFTPERMAHQYRAVYDYAVQVQGERSVCAS
jgi:glycosyltransferase involved in cell wall biosynthesis